MSTNQETNFAHVERCIAIVRNGGIIVMVDDEDRENEGDLVIAADHCTADAVNFMCREARGLVCLALTPQRIEQLQLPMMVPKRPDDMSTAFTVSIEAREGVTTGISASDRARTIRVATDPSCGPSDIVSPGHVFPLRAQAGGVLVRSGHTEGSVDLARLAGCNPAAVICEIMRNDGQMARMDDLREFARAHELEVLTIADLIEYRLRNELLVEQVDSASLPSPVLGLELGPDWTIRTFRSTIEPESHFVVLTKGDLAARDDDEGVLLRAQRADMIGDLFGTASRRSGARLRAALRQIDAAGSGVFLYVVGDGGTRQRLTLGAERDGNVPARPRDVGFRDFGLGAQVLRALGVRSIRVMTNNPRKIVGLEGFGIAVAGSVPLEADA